ncbi:hypothetical protein BGZ61DRAFT_485755 [Ilyonectria robusta]|uniref:uncharacterized protein n=1 Tax=Ilyonectria robusta TaxID=1079257 RepID=UPI001E8E58AB|nr:uncharacterized protein BGZ61DRAFT_485755 [Ilyonectria robusta]KAH8659558.1 hypothetical protein BGZ61DRAFT_485755 [Ilyonectria robusta]
MAPPFRPPRPTDPPSTFRVPTYLLSAPPLQLRMYTFLPVCVFPSFLNSQPCLGLFVLLPVVVVMSPKASPPPGAPVSGPPPIEADTAACSLDAHQCDDDDDNGSGYDTDALPHASASPASSSP